MNMNEFVGYIMYKTSKYCNITLSEEDCRNIFEEMVNDENFIKAFDSSFPGHKLIIDGTTLN